MLFFSPIKAKTVLFKDQPICFYNIVNSKLLQSLLKRLPFLNGSDVISLVLLSYRYLHFGLDDDQLLRLDVTAFNALTDRLN